MKILISEKQLEFIITEQGFGGSAGIVGTPQDYSTRQVKDDDKLSCLPDKRLKPFVYYVIINKVNISKKLGISLDLIPILIKAAIGIMKRETDFNTSISAVGEKFLDWFDNTFLNRELEKSHKLRSVGPSQFTYGTWNSLDLEKKFGMNKSDMRTFTGAGLGTMALLVKNYNLALSLGYSNNTRSVNPFLSKKGINFLSTNNAALDVAIASHNMELLKKYCYTNNPNIAGPCDQPTYEPYSKGSSNYQKYKTLQVYQNKPIKNYFPNKKSGKLTSIGYLEEVVKVINSLNCITI